MASHEEPVKLTEGEAAAVSHSNNTDTDDNMASPTVDIINSLTLSSRHKPVPNSKLVKCRPIRGVANTNTI